MSGKVIPFQRGYYLPILERLSRWGKGAARGGVFAFTAATRGEGVSYVTDSLAGQLLDENAGNVLVLSSHSLMRLSPAKVRTNQKIYVRRGDSAITVYDRELLPFAVTPDQLADTMELLRNWFHYTLIDCSPLEESAEALTIGHYADGMVWVVGAGQAPRQTLERTSQLLAESDIPLLGCVLNRRTYPVPDPVYRRLG